MTAKELIDKLSEVAPETEIVGGLWNGRVDTYTVLDELHVFQYDQIEPGQAGGRRQESDMANAANPQHAPLEGMEEGTNL